MTTNQDADSFWVYHERQQALLCGQHALNNLAQGNLFSVDHLATIATTLDQMEQSIDTDYVRGGPSHHVDDAGNFSIEVLKAALSELLGITLVLRKVAKEEITTFQGFLCHKSDHWFAIRNVGGRFWNLNSTLERPEVVSHFTLGSEMETCEQQGYTVFCIPDGLPEGGTKDGSAAATGSENWHLLSDLLRGKSTAADPWEKMDGRGRTLKAERTEEELMQIALDQSLTAQVPVPEEPPTGEGVRIQFRLPGRPRVVRRFRTTDLVAGIFAYCESQGGAMQLQYGFPPKDLGPLREQTIEAAKLANETIQGRPL